MTGDGTTTAHSERRGLAPRRPLHVAVAIAGAASLGTFEAGALAGLITGLRPLCTGKDAPVRLDIVTGSSSGAITGTLAAHCLTRGIDVVDVMREAWLEQASLETLRGRGFDAPLSLERLRAAMADLVDDRRWPATSPTEGIGPVRVAMSLVSLRGQLAPQAAAPSFLRWAVHELDGASGGGLVDAMDHALASSANSLAFGPRLVGRAPDGMVDPGATPIDVSTGGWFTDGGTLDDEPLSRALSMARDDGGDVARLLLLVHPFSLTEPTGPGWRDPAVRPSWSATLLRCIEVQRGQRLVLDLREVERSNDQVAALRSRFPDDDEFEDARRDLSIEQRRCVGYDILSPTTGDDGRGVSAASRLSGDLLANLGGFASRALRVSDFDLGYRCALAWFEQQAERSAQAGGPPEHVRSTVDAVAVLDPELWRAAQQAAFTRYLPGRGHLRTGAATLRSLAPAEKLALARVGARTAGVLVHDALRARGLTQEPVSERRAPVPLASLRNTSRWIHGNGITFGAVFELASAVPAASHLFPDRAGALVRISASLPRKQGSNWLGVGVRVMGDDPIDLTLASSRPAPVLRHALLPGPSALSRAFVSSSLRYHVGDERLVVGGRLPELPAAISIGDLTTGDAARRETLRDALSGTRIDLSVARVTGRWYRLGTVTLGAPVADHEVEPPLRFAPTRGARRSSPPAIRDRWYAASQRGERPPWLVRAVLRDCLPHG